MLLGVREIVSCRRSEIRPSFITSCFHSRAHDTVGAVAVDCAGNVACATSTGGIRNKMVGRVGNSPVIGKTVSVQFQLISSPKCEIEQL